MGMIDATGEEQQQPAAAPQQTPVEPTPAGVNPPAPEAPAVNSAFNAPVDGQESEVAFENPEPELSADGFEREAPPEPEESEFETVAPDEPLELETP